MHQTIDLFLLYNNLFIYQVLCTLICRRLGFYSFLLIQKDLLLGYIKSGARATKHISIEFEIRWKFKTL